MKVFSKDKYYADGGESVSEWSKEADGHEVKINTVVSDDNTGYCVDDAWCVDAPHELTDKEILKQYGNTAGTIPCDKCPAYEFCESGCYSDKSCIEIIKEYFTAGNWRPEESKPDIGIPMTSEPETDDPVNHPSHYTQGGIECIDAMESAFGAQELMIYCKIAAFKYLWRAEHKHGAEDVEKARWYISKYLALGKGGSAE